MKKFLFGIAISLFANLTFAEPDLSHAVGQMMMVGFHGTTINEHSIIVQEIKKYHIGGVILVNHHKPNSKAVHTNVENPTQLKKLIEQLQFYSNKYNGHPLLIAVNQEGGFINMLKPIQGFATKDDPSQAELGKTNSQKLIFDKTYQRAELLKKYGINLNLAPVADLNINPENPGIGKLQRSFGDDPVTVTSDLQSAISAYKKANVFCTLKHFPGLGSANQNTDYADANVTTTWNIIELQPYENLIKQGNACDFVMVTHLVNTKLDASGLPVSLSKKVINDLLIQKLHFNGVVITDDMDAAAIRKNIPAEIAIEKAVLAGNNIIIYGGTQGYDPDEDTELLFNTLIKLAKTNKQIKQQIITSYQKIMTVKQHIRI